MRILTLTTFGRAIFSALTRGRRDFISLSATVRSRFEVLVDAAQRQRTTTVLAGMSR